VKLKNRHIIILLVLTALCRFSSYAQDVRATSGIDSTVIVIGNQTKVHLKVSYDAKGGMPKIQWPFIPDSLMAKVHVVSKSKIDTVIPDHANPTEQSQTQDLVITSFDSGYYAIPPFQFIVNGDTAHPVMTDAMMLQVRTLPVDTTKAFRDIKGPIQVKFPLIIILMYVGIGLAVLIILGLILYYILKNNKGKVIEPVEIKAPPIDPHIKALKALEELAMQKLWQEGKIKEYYSGISEIMRTYLDDKTRLGALEMTTDEIMYALRRRNEFSEELKNQLRQILVLSDLVKFAKEQPIEHEHQSTLSNAVDFINKSIRVEEPIIQRQTPVTVPPTPVAPPPAPENPPTV